MIDIKLFIYIVLAIISIGGAVVTFFVMQAKQNMRLDLVEKNNEETKKKTSDQSKYQIQTEKNIIEINGNMKNMDDKLDMVIKMMGELKDQGCGKCSGKT